ARRAARARAAAAPVRGVRAGHGWVHPVSRGAGLRARARAGRAPAALGGRGGRAAPLGTQGQPKVWRSVSPTATLAALAASDHSQARFSLAARARKIASAPTAKISASRTTNG